MRKIFVALTVLLCLLTASTVLAAKSADEQRAEIKVLHDKALKNLYEKFPNANRVIQKCYAYATLSNTGIKLGIFGDAHGRGVAVNNTTGERVYLKMAEQSAGIGLGVKEYDLIFLIGTREAWDNFLAGKIRFAANADAAATDGATGGSIEGATYVAPGVWVYQMTTKGLAVEATLKGMKVWRDKKLSPIE
ncbi:MAG: hypothetical protein IJ774_03415 [Selenomonadaceae bacterium]|nr:hypothetical protein [Selenomonadaceae bacterium]